MNYERRLINRLAAGRSTATLIRRQDHGTRKCYVAGCHCDPCTDAEALYNRLRHRPPRRKETA